MQQRTSGFFIAASMVLIVGAETARAEFVSRNTVGMGFTSNANLTEEAPMSDTYFRATTSNSLQLGAQDLGLRVGYTDYSSASENDALSVRVSDSLKRPESAWGFTGTLLGQFYTTGSPATTDTAFDNIGFDFEASRAIELAAATNLEHGAGYRGRFYTSYQGRNDHTAYLVAGVDHGLTRKLALGALGELGLIHSSLPEFSRLYIELSASADYSFAARWEWSSEILLSQTSFTSRTITTTTEVTRRRGGTAQAMREENEAYSYLSLSTELMRRHSETLRWGIGLTSSSQASRSGLQDYSAFEALLRLNMVF